MMPDFASTIHSATGRTLSAAIPDLGRFMDAPSPSMAMEGMIALSRVKRMEDVAIARSFTPGLFQQGPAVFPTLLLDVLKGQVKKDELKAHIKEAEARAAVLQSDQSEAKLRNLMHPCGTCGKTLHVTNFVKRTPGDSWYAAVRRRLPPRRLRDLPCMQEEKVGAGEVPMRRLQGLQDGGMLSSQRG
jgi:hypothetical protein